MVPILEPTTAAEVAYNVAHKKSRNTIERAIGTMKSRFRCCCKQSGGGIQFDPQISCKIITSCVVLHNYCRDRNIDQEVHPDVQLLLQEQGRATPPNIPAEGHNERVEILRGLEARRGLIANTFAC